MSLDKTDIVRWPSPHLPRLDDSMLGMGAQWEDDSDKCQCEWPGPGSLVSPSLVPVTSWCVGQLGAVLPGTLLILQPQPVPVTSCSPTLRL